MGGINAEKPHRATLRKCTVSSSSPLPQLPPYITRCIVFFKQQRSWSYQDDITKYESQVVPFISTSSWIKRVLYHWLTSDAKIQPVFTRRKAVAFGFSHHGHSLVTREPRVNRAWTTRVRSRSSSYFHSLVAQNLTGEFTRKIYALSRNVFSDSWSWQFCVILFLYKIKDSCYQDSFVIHGWFVYWVFGWEMRRFSKSSEIRFLMASFSKMSLYLTLLDAYEGWKVWGDSGLTWWLSGAASGW